MFQKDKFADLLDAPGSKPDPKSIQGLIAWLETQDGATPYDQSDCHSCMICRYASALAGKSLSWNAATTFLGENPIGISGFWTKTAYGNTWAPMRPPKRTQWRAPSSEPVLMQRNPLSRVLLRDHMRNGEIA